LFGGFRDYGQGLDPTALDRANRYGMAAAAATLMKSDPYDTRYGTKLFGSLLSGKMAMRDQLAEQQELLAKKRAAEILAARQEQEWEWKKAEAERKDREWWEKESTPEVGGGVDDEIASANLWAEKTGKDPSIFLGLPKVAQVAEMKKLTEAPEVPEEFIEGGSRWIRGADGKLINRGFIPERPEKPKLAKGIDFFKAATDALKYEQVSEPDPLDPSKAIKRARFDTFEEALDEVRRRAEMLGVETENDPISPRDAAKLTPEEKVAPVPSAPKFTEKNLAQLRVALANGQGDLARIELKSRGFTDAQIAEFIAVAKKGRN